MASDLVQQLRDASLVHPTIPLALARIEQLEAQRSQEWRERFDELLEDYAMARVETALFNVTQSSGGRPIRMAKPRLASLLAHLTGETK